MVAVNEPCNVKEKLIESKKGDTMQRIHWCKDILASLLLTIEQIILMDSIEFLNDE